MGEEWEMCEHCDGYRPNHEGRFVISAHPPLMPGRSWTEEERTAPVGAVTCGICLLKHP